PRLVARRAPPALQRSPRRHERGRTAPRAASIRTTISCRISALHVAAQSSRRHDRVGPGPRLARQHLRAHAHRARPLLHRELVPAVRPQNPLHDRDPRPAASERVLAGLQSALNKTKRRKFMRPRSLLVLILVLAV